MAEVRDLGSPNAFRMKTVFIALSTGMEIKNFLLGDFYKLAKAQQDLRLIVFVPQEKSERYKQEFGHERCIMEPMVDLEQDKRPVKKFFRVLMLASIPTRTIRSRQKFVYLSGGSLLAFSGKRLIWLLGHMRMFRALLRALEYYIFHDDRAWLPYFDRYRPDLVFGAALKYEESMVLLKAAKRRRVASIGMAASWDNFSSKLFLSVHPDMLLVQNESMVGEAERLGDYPSGKIRVVGFPQFDHYFDLAWVMNKEEVASIIGADPAKRWITYFTGGLLMGGLRMEDLRDQADVVIGAMKSEELPNSQLLVRIHPVDPIKFEPKNPNVKVLDFGRNFDFSAEEMKLLANLVRLSDVTVNFGSTMTLEAAIFDRPVISVGFNGYADAKVPTFRRLAWALDNTTHYDSIEKSGGVWRAKSPEDFVSALKTYLENPSLHREGRERIVKGLVGRLDGTSGRRILDAVLCCV